MHFNRLSKEKNPYLLQHAGNPVDWFPWSEEAFNKALEEDKPVFLSIGYSSCHWCHVMEKESFIDEKIAEILNNFFISIKVDREERPDIDNLYMKACQVMTGSGGWPLTIVMTPDKKPFFSGTYFPKNPKHGMQGLIFILESIADMWRNSRKKLLNTGESVVRYLSLYDDNSNIEIDEKIFNEAYEYFRVNFDGENGGFGNAPKFPSPHNVSFLLRYYKRTGKTEALEMSEKSLKKMYKGGIFDHLGYGFHRYSTDKKWLVPHFEKMIYDQALIAISFTEAFQITGKEIYKNATYKVFEYVLRDMTSTDGGFYSSEDADSEGEEGKFYVWKKKEIVSILGKMEGNLFCDYYGISEKGNFQYGKNIIHITSDLKSLSKKSKISEKELQKILEKSRKKLYLERKRRKCPLRDDKILTDWNGLMIAAFSKAFQAFGKTEYINAAKRSANFILNKMIDKNNVLYHRYRDGETAVKANINDYAFLIWGLIEMYESVFEIEYMEKAIAMSEEMLKKFWDVKRGGFYFTSDDSSDLIVRGKEFSDSAVPSGNSIAALALSKIGKYIKNQDYIDRVRKILSAHGNMIKKSPGWFTQMLTAYDFTEGPVKEIIVSGDRKNEKTVEIIRYIHERFLPNKVLIFNPAGEKNSKTEKLYQFLKNYPALRGKTTIYICENYSCKLPVTNIEEMKKLLIEKN